MFHEVQEFQQLTCWFVGADTDMGTAANLTPTTTKQDKHFGKDNHDRSGLSSVVVSWCFD